MGMYGDGMPVTIPDRSVPAGEPIPIIGCNYVDADYFTTLQIALVRGRAFRDSDTENAPRVAVVNENMASRFWPNQDPIGKRFRAGRNETLTEVVGVARDGKYLAVFENRLPYFFVPEAQYFDPLRVLQIRTVVPPESLRARLEREVASLDPNMPVTDLQSMMRVLNGPQGFLIFRMGTVQAGAMGLLGLILAVVGVYGVVSYGAAQRTREIGIRMALGATPEAVLRTVLSQGVWLVLGGLAVGLPAALALARLLRRFLLRVSASDPWTFAGVSALLTAVALLACYLPARRAMRVDPMNALRHE